MLRAATATATARLATTTGRCRRGAPASLWRGLATEAGAEEAGQAAAEDVPPEDRGVGEPGQTVAVNIFKTGTDPVLLRKSEYPEWLFEITKPPLTEKQVLSQKDTIKWKSGAKKYFRKLNKRRIKERNQRGDAL